VHDDAGTVKVKSSREMMDSKFVTEFLGDERL
jgi:hypothetical protein